ncbi:MAG: hypothetical protein CUN54_02545 [Phototrophicales bacterium]|nr:MAG: hypothetical protein CUN54_02545 [Phototrophicales bacterium]
MRTLIMKFGGSALGTTTALTQVLSIVLQEHERWERLLLVASALDGVTDQLIEAAHFAQIGSQRKYRRIVANLRSRHLTLIDNLPLGSHERATLQADIDRLLFDMLDQCQLFASRNDNKETVASRVDAIIGTGERLSTRIIAALLRKSNLRGIAIDASDFIITNNIHGHAAPDIALTKQRVSEHLLPIMGRNIIPVVTGFIGSTEQGNLTTLGRGGSDYTASILGVCTNADEIWIWSDVDGMMTGDPRILDGTHVIPTLSYEEVAELAYFGARILHNQMIVPLKEANIPLYIKNVFKPQEAGTLIHDMPHTKKNKFKAVTWIQGIGLRAQHSGPLSSILSVVDDTLYDITNAHADVTISSQSSTESFFAFVIPTSAGTDAIHNVQLTLQTRLAQNDNAQSWEVNPVTIITVIGQHDHIPTAVAELFSVLKEVTIRAVAQGPSKCTLSIVVEPSTAEKTLALIHQFICDNL